MTVLSRREDPAIPPAPPLISVRALRNRAVLVALLIVGLFAVYAFWFRDSSLVAVKTVKVSGIGKGKLEVGEGVGSGLNLRVEGCEGCVRNGAKKVGAPGVITPRLRDGHQSGEFLRLLQVEGFHGDRVQFIECLLREWIHRRCQI